MTNELDTTKVKPFIMIVEDRKDGRDYYARILRDLNCSVITASTAKEALKCYMTSPKLNLVFTDIDLLGNRTRDKGGVDIARFIKHLDNELPVVGYSSKFKDNELTYQEKEYFDEWYDKGSLGIADITDMCDKLKEKANQHKTQRFNEIVKLFNRLRAKNIIRTTDKDFEDVLKLAISYDTTPFSQVDEAISENGYELKLVNPQPGKLIDKPFLIWTRSDEDIYEIEVYGYSDLYSFAKTEEDALNSLISLMEGFALDMKSEEPENFAGPALHLRKFLLYILK